MRPQDIDKIANLVVGSLSGVPGAGLLGCGSVTSGQDFDIVICTDPTAPFFFCDDGGSYECGGEARFLCCAGFVCETDFVCPGPSRFGCASSEDFLCAESFVCGEQDTFDPTSGLCGLPG